MVDVDWNVIGIWFTGIATASAVMFAWYSGRIESQREILRQEREQAEDISTWVAAEKRPLPVKLSNSSHDPVYNVIVSVVLVQGKGPQNGKETFMQRSYNVLPPGDFLIHYDDYPDGGTHTKPGTEIAFTDKGGRHWLKDKNGKLRSLGNESPTHHYGMKLPIDWLYLDDDKVV
jgi:hypothetical protein